MTSLPKFKDVVLQWQLVQVLHLGVVSKILYPNAIVGDKADSCGFRGSWRSLFSSFNRLDGIKSLLYNNGHASGLKMSFQFR